MTDPQTPDPTTPPAADASSPQAPARADDAAAPAEAASPTTSTEQPKEAGAEAQADASGDSGAPPGAGDDGGADDGGDEGDGDGAEAAEGGAPGTTADGAPKKRRRRRRKKKGPPAEGQAAEGAAPAEGAPPAEGGEPRPPRQPKPKRERVERERPAFNVGDVVFGKVIEFTEDALYVDLAGKAKAIFDLRELLITEDDVEEYTKADRKEADELAAARAASAAGAASAAAGASPAGGDASATDESPSAPVETSAEEASAAPVPVEARASEGAASEDASEGTSALEAAAAEGAAPEAAAPEAAASEGASAETGASEAGASEAGASETGASEGDAAEATGAPADGAADKNAQLPHVILEPGAPFVGLVHNDGGRGGLVVLTHHPKRVQKAKPVVSEASRSGTLIFGLVTGTIKGGVEVDVDGLRAFAPASHVELRPGADLSHLVGKRLPFAVTQYAKRGRDVVLSRRAMLETEAKEKREEALKNIQMGGVVDGIVRTVVPFGAFVDVGGVEGLVPLSEMSHNRADQPKDVFKLGETVRVKILRLDERGKLWLSRKAAIEDPWSQVAQKYAQGTKHTGKVARLQPFGAFVELEPGIDGLIHSADLSVKRIEHPEEIVKVGDEIEVVVASVDQRQHRIALHPAPTGEAANEEPQRVQLHKVVKVVVVSVESGGLVVRVLGATGRSARGFVSASATGTPRGTELRKLFPVGKQLDVKITELDPRRGELKLSIKALNEENERNAYQQYRAQVKREAKFGTFADLLAKRNITSDK
ncbi:MAG: S1 RNA-binding domain-containing protein [Labilithrix sp.]|nr:S1 RNA-binding domain-containing protein [Labilithrix sp.]